MFASLFEKPKTLKQQSREWERELKRQMRELDKASRKIQRDENKVKQEIKRLAKKNPNQRQALTTLSKSVVRSKNHRSRLLESKVQLNSVLLQIKSNMATHVVVGQMRQSTNIMRMMSSLIRVPEISKAARDMSREMMKAGIMEEIVEDAFDDMDEELEAEADAEVDAVLFELTQGMLGKDPTITNNLTVEEEEEDILADNGELEEMKARLDKLVS